MANPIDPKTWEDAEKAYINGVERSLAAIATRFSLGKRTVEKYAAEHDWDAKRKAGKVVAISKPKPITDSAPRDEVAYVRTRRQAEEINELEVVRLAIGDVSAMMGGSEIDARGMGSCASALCKLVELHLKLKPRTAADLADLLIASRIPVREFVQILKERQQASA